MHISSLSQSGLIFLAWTFVVVLGPGCSSSPPAADPPPIQTVSLADFADTSEVSVTLAEGLELDLWAPGPLLHNAVAISIDNQGVAYVSETERRKSSDLDIRQHRDWMTEELKLQTIEETEAFHKSKLAPELSDQNKWQEDFNGDSLHDWRDLMVQSERVRKIWDQDGDGRADASQVYAEDFRDMLTGVAAGVLVQGDAVYVTAAPDLWKVEDENQDGIGDKQTSISYGYGIHIAYAGHDMSGLTMGPDGKLYWSIGDIGVNAVGPDGKRWAYPNEGAVMRCNPDGSEFEVFAHGLRNPQEIAFDAYGNLISVDNDGDHPGEHERIVHILEGSDTGWRINWQFGKYQLPGEDYKVWMDEQLSVPHFPGQAAYLLPPLALAKDGPAGLAYNPGTALSEELAGYFFSSHFTASSSNSEIVGIRLEPKGASFSVAEQKPISKGIVSTGLSFGPEGGLYMTDWMDGYDKKETGRIWRLDAVAGKRNPLREETRRLLAEGMKARSKSELADLLGHADMRVRMEAQFELVNRKESGMLIAATQGDQPQLARLHAIWGIGQLVRGEGLDGSALVGLLADGDPEVRAQAAKVVGETRHESAEPALLNLLEDPSGRVQYFAAEALGKLKTASAFEPLVRLLVVVGESDPHLRHGLMLALSRIAETSKIAALTDHDSEAVRIGAVVALRHQQAPEVAAFLADESPLVVVEAARAIHDDTSIPAALSTLAESLLRASTQEEAFVRRAINANLRLGDEASAQRLSEYVDRSNAPAALRANALRALGYWQEPPVLDRVEGRYRELPARDPQLALAALSGKMEPLLLQNNPDLSIATAWAAGRLGDQGQVNTLMSMVKAKGKTASVRAAALQALRDMDAPQKVQGLELALASPDADLRDAAQQMMSGFELPEDQEVNMLATVLIHGKPREQQRALTNLGEVQTPESAQILGEWMDKLIAGEVAPEAQLDLLLAAEANAAPALLEKVAAYDATRSTDDPLASHRETMYGGNVRQGMRTAYLHPSAQCFRCHMVEGRGGAVGPDLTGIASRLSQEQLLEALIEPSARLAPGYGTVVLNLKSGDKLVGTLLEETPNSIRLTTVEGGEQKIALSDIEKKQIAPSGMPSMREMITKTEMRDILAFLGSLKE